MRRCIPFIVGCQRSGTTLLRLMLNAHSMIAIPEEGTFWMPLLRRVERDTQRKIEGKGLENFLKYVQNNSQFLTWGLDAEKIVGKVTKRGSFCIGSLMSLFYRDYAKAYGKDIWGDKTPGFFRMIPTLAKLFPQARFVHIVRDGRDLYLSWQKMGVVERNTSVAALEWVWKTRTAEKGLRGLPSCRRLTIKYEELVAEPEKILKDVCKFIGVTFESNMMDYWKTSKRFIGTHHSNLIFKPVSMESIGKWKNELPKKEIEKFEIVAGGTLASFGYELDGNNNIRFIPTMRVLIELGLGVPKRALRVFHSAYDLNKSSRLGLPTVWAGRGNPPGGER